jgi:hypothetical protein
LLWFREHSIDGVVESYFVTNDEDGNEIELVEGGSSLMVTDQNKEYFIKLKCDYIA